MCHILIVLLFKKLALMKLVDSKGSAVTLQEAAALGKDADFLSLSEVYCPVKNLSTGFSSALESLKTPQYSKLIPMCTNKPLDHVFYYSKMLQVLLLRPLVFKNQHAVTSLMAESLCDVTNTFLKSRCVSALVIVNRKVLLL